MSFVYVALMAVRTIIHRYHFIWVSEPPTCQPFPLLELELLLLVPINDGPIKCLHLFLVLLLIQITESYSYGQ